jgi:LPXTG-motif cell wall-anchored protein
MRILLGFLFILVSAQLHAEGCGCPLPSKIDKEECAYYNVIALGTVQSVGLCEGEIQKAEILIDELYKGGTNRKTEIIMDCSATCPIQLASGETWLFFLEKNNAQELVLKTCTHSRKKMPEEIQNYDDEVFGMSFGETKNFLRNNFEVNAHFQNDLKPRAYQKVSGTQAIIFVTIGLVAMLLGYFFFARKKTKNNP